MVVPAEEANLFVKCTIIQNSNYVPKEEKPSQEILSPNGSVVETTEASSFGSQTSLTLETPARGKSYPPPLSATALKRRKLKFFVPPDPETFTSDEDDDAMAEAAKDRLLFIYGKQSISHERGKLSKADTDKLSNSANPEPSTSRALSRQLKRIRATVQRLQPVHKTIKKTKKREETETLPSSRVQPSRLSKVEGRSSDTAPAKKKKTELLRQKRKQKQPKANLLNGDASLNPDTKAENTLTPRAEVKKSRNDQSESPRPTDEDDIPKQTFTQRNPQGADNTTPSRPSRRIKPLIIVTDSSPPVFPSPVKTEEIDNLLSSKAEVQTEIKRRRGKKRKSPAKTKEINSLLPMLVEPQTEIKPSGRRTRKPTTKKSKVKVTRPPGTLTDMHTNDDKSLETLQPAPPTVSESQSATTSPMEPRRSTRKRRPRKFEDGWVYLGLSSAI